MRNTNKKPKSAPKDKPSIIKAITKKKKLSLEHRLDVAEIMNLSRNMSSLLRAYEDVRWIDATLAKPILDKHEELKTERNRLFVKVGLR